MWSKITFVFACSFLVGFITPSKSRGDALAIGFCPKVVGSVAPARGPDLDTAKRKALQNCRAFGGSSGCCKVIVELDDDNYDNCIAIAVGSGGKYGSGSGMNELDAGSEAVEDCPAQGCVIKSQFCRERSR